MKPLRCGCKSRRLGGYYKTHARYRTSVFRQAGRFPGSYLTQLSEHFDEIMSSGYSVSLFTSWRNKLIDQVWVKRKLADVLERYQLTFSGHGPQPKIYTRSMASRLKTAANRWGRRAHGSNGCRISGRLYSKQGRRIADRVILSLWKIRLTQFLRSKRNAKLSLHTC
jgi:hypothetical protein